MQLISKITFICFITFLFSSSAQARVRCSQFDTQADAQAYMHTYEAYYLDRDKDGEACECLPGGSKYGDSICNR